MIAISIGGGLIRFGGAFVLVLRALFRMLLSPSSPSRAFAGSLCCALAATAVVAGAATADQKRSYHFPKGDAATILAQFATDSGQPILFMMDTVRGQRTNAIEGNYTHREALDRLLEGTVLIAVQDPKSGGFVINRRPAVGPSDKKAKIEGDQGLPKAPPPEPRVPPTDQSKIAPKQLQLSMKPRNLLALIAGWLSAATVLEAQSLPPPSKDETVILSPFEVVENNRGYQAVNTMSGTRMNAKLEDLGASISVVTKQQMTDFAMLDFNDIANYEAGTEGTGNFTDYSFNRNGQQISNVTFNPAQANRLRGVGAANTTIGNFETSGRVPMDPLNVESVEISRGPNAAIFGIGTASGTVNQVPSAANLSKDKSQLSARGDSDDGYRFTFDLNRVLVRDKLALRASAARQYDGYALKPSGTNTQRYNGMVRYRPFRNTMLTASASSYRLEGNRPNSNTPADMVSGWIRQGSPTFNGVNSTITVNGVTRARTATDLTDYTAPAASGQIYADQGGIGFWGTGQTTLSATPATISQSGRLYDSNPDPDRIRNQPLFQRFPAVNNKNIYDWSTQNIALLNRAEDHARFASALLDQVVLDTPKQMLAFQLGWFHEDGSRYARNILAADSRAPGILGFMIDINETRLDGTPNTYFKRPYIPSTLPYDSKSEINRDTYRAQLAYKLDLTGAKNWTRWLGLHQVTAYDEYKHFTTRILYTADNVVDKHTWLPAGTLNSTGPSVVGGIYRFYVGDANGQNADYLPQNITYGPYTLNYGNAVTGFTKEPVQLGSAVLNFSGGGGNELRIQKARGGILQSHLLQGRIVTTFGERRDELYTRPGGTVRYNADGITLDRASYEAWTPNNWNHGKGPTRTAGVVVKPLPWLSLFYNKSDSFVPASQAQSLFLKVLPDPSGKGSDAGFGLSLFGGKLFVRANQYTTKQFDSRTGSSAQLGSRVQRLDFNDSSVSNGFFRDAFRLQTKAAEWFTAEATAAGTTLTAAQLETKVATLMELPVEYLRPFANPVYATNDVIAKGREVELNYNPSDFWTVRANVTEQEAIDANISPDIGDWLAKRIPVWEKLVDPLLGTPWYTTNYNNQGSAKSWVDGLVIAPLKLARAQEGKSRPQVRKYRVNLSTNYRLQGIVENPILKRFNVGGSLRWEDKGAIGYFGNAQLPAIITDLDVNRPIYDGTHTYVDLLAGYRAPFFSKRVTATWQLNVRNVNESGRLQKIGANPDGTPTAYRIITPRQFILSATFDL